jgi:cupin superfamily acireductone dioxygenase involved in methionine salvage
MMWASCFLLVYIYIPYITRRWIYLHSLHYKKVILFTFPTLQEGDFIYIPYITRRWFYLHSLHYKKVILFTFPTLQEGDFIYIPYITRRWFYLNFKKVRFKLHVIETWYEHLSRFHTTLSRLMWASCLWLV